MRRVLTLFDILQTRCARRSGITGVWAALVVIALLVARPASAQVTPTNEAFVQSLYLDLLGRPADAGALPSRESIALILLDSDEYRGVRVREFYSDFLGRTPPDAELNPLVTFLETNRLQQGRALILGSAEYFANRGGSTNAGFVGAVFNDLLGRPADPTELSTFGGQLTAGTLTRPGLADQLQASQEGRRVIVEGYYQQFLRRPADDAGLNGFSELLGRGTTEQQVIAAIVGSAEYFNRVPEPSSAIVLSAVGFGLGLSRRRAV
jgi:hypothetical protein